MFATLGPCPDVDGLLAHGKPARPSARRALSMMASAFSRVCWRQVGEFASDAQDGGLCLVTACGVAQHQLRPDCTHPAAGRAEPAPERRAVIFISVVGCGTRPSMSIRQNRRHEIESLTSRHSVS